MATYNADQINQLFNQMLGRAPTADEHKFLQPYVEAGQISPYEIGQYLQGTPEAQQARLGQQQTNYQGLVTGQNQQILNQAANAANGQFAQAGRQWSSGQGNSILQAGQQLAAQQTPMIANYYGQGQQGLNDIYNQYGANALNRTYNLADSQTAYNRTMQAFYNGKNDYNDYLNQANQRNRNQAIGGLIGSVAGGAIGGGFGGPAGAQAGAQGGGILGRTFGGF